MTALWTPPVNFTFRESMTSTWLNEVLIADMEHVGTPPQCEVNNVSNIGLSNNAFTDCTFDNEVVDTDVFHDVSTHNERFTIPTGMGGWFHVIGFVAFVANGTGERGVGFAINGTLVQQVDTEDGRSTGVQVMGGMWDFQLNPGDYITLQAYQNSGGGMTLGPYSGGSSPAGASFRIVKFSA